MSEFALARALSDNGRAAEEYHCFCLDCDDSDIGDDGNDGGDGTKFIRLGCRCVLHYHCLSQYVRSKLGGRLIMSLNGISCPYGSECKSFKTLDEVEGDESKIYYITTTDLDNIVDYGSKHPKLQQYLDEHGCEALTHEEVSGLREWIDERRNEAPKKFTDEDYDLFIISTTKACPSCGYRSTHYHGHQCHHISPARPPQRGGCPNCHINYCYKCLSTEVENRRDRGSDANCRCGYWSNFCHPIKSASAIKKHIGINEGGIPYDTRCGCVICSDCRYGKSCEFCSGDCCVCTGYVNPSPNEVTDSSSEQKRWKAEGPALNTGNSSSDTSLWDCCRHGNDVALRRLLESGTVTAEEVNRQDRDGRTALYLACDARHSDCVRLLLAFDGIDVNIPDFSNNSSPLHIACDGVDTEIINLLLSHDGTDVNRFAYTETPLHKACVRGHTNIVRLLLSHDGIDVNKDAGGWTPLHIACEEGHSEIVNLLLSHDGIDVNRTNDSGDTPLYFAYCFGHSDIVSMLLSHGGTSNGDTSLWDCCRHGNDVALRRLLESGTVTAEEVNRRDRDGRTALYLACDARHSDCVRLLLAFDGIDVNLGNFFGSTPLHAAGDRSHTDIVSLLLSHDGTDVNRADRDGDTPLYKACVRGHTEIVSLLLSHDGIDVSIADNDGMTLLHIACEEDHSEIVSMLLSHDGTDVNTAKIYGMTLLHFACERGHTDTVRLLLSHDGIDVNIADDDGCTPLFIACDEDRTEIVSLLLSHDGIDVSRANEDGRTPLQIASGRGHTDIVSLLQSHDV